MIADRDGENPEKIDSATPKSSRPIPGRRKNGLWAPEGAATPDPYDFHKFFTGHHM